MNTEKMYLEKVKTEIAVTRKIKTFSYVFKGKAFFSSSEYIFN